MTARYGRWWMFCLVAMTFVSRSASAQWREERRETVFSELGLGASGNPDDAYRRGLEREGYHESTMDFSVGWTLSLGMMFQTSQRGPDIGPVFRWERLALQELVQGGDRDVALSWDTRAASLGVRLRQPLAGEWLAAYGQLHGGLAYARVERGKEPTNERTHRGLSLGGTAGLAVNFLEYAGMFLEAGYTYAPVLENAAGHHHNDGGVSVAIGWRARLVTRT